MQSTTNREELAQLVPLSEITDQKQTQEIQNHPQHIIHCFGCTFACLWLLKNKTKSKTKLVAHAKVAGGP